MADTVGSVVRHAKSDFAKPSLSVTHMTNKLDVQDEFKRVIKVPHFLYNKLIGFCNQLR